MIHLKHQEMIETLSDYIKHYTIIEGLTDVVIDNKTNPYLYTLKDNVYWVIVGRLPDEDIISIMNDDSFSESDGIKCEGHYHYKAAIYYKHHTWEEPAESYIDYIEFDFIETFQERDREAKLNQILYDNDDFFTN